MSTDSTTLTDHLRSLCIHDRDATRRLIVALREANVQQQEVWDKLAHCIAAQHLWLHRCGVLADTPDEVFPAGHSPEQVERDAEAVGAAWESYVASLSPVEASREVVYAALEGTRHTNVLADILLHLSMHGQYHRGQVARLARDSLSGPIVMDYILHVRGDQEV